MNRVMSRFAAVACSLCVSKGGAAAAIIPRQLGGPTAVQIDAIVKEGAKPTAPGLAVAVYRKGSVVFETARGAADLEHHVTLSPRSVFEIASMSKQFTAFAVVLLSKDGKLSLDDDIEKYIPELQLPQRVTIRQLLQHTSGIRDYIDLMELAGQDPEGHDVTQDEILRTISRIHSLNFAPGSQFSYENTSYALMATLVQRVSGKSLRAFAQDRIFRPLGMNSTRFEDDHSELIDNRAVGYAGTVGAWKLALPGYDEIGDGGVWTTVEDLAKWDRNFYEPKVGGASAIATLTSQARLIDGQRMSYALGLFIQQRDGLLMISHGGVDAGYRAQMLRFPTRGLTVTVLGNNADLDVEGVARRIADLYLGTTSANATAGPLVKSAGDPGLVGRYVDVSSGRTREITNDPTFALKSGGKTYPLASAYGRAFTSKGFDGSITFRRSAGGSQMMIIDWYGQSPTVMRRLPEKPADQDLSALTGSYASSELAAVWAITLNQSTLSLDVPKLGSSKLVALDRDLFESDFGLVSFDRDSAGRVTGLTFSNVRDSGLKFSRST